ncbi:hypothetical protein ACFVXC_24005 [Streptomyces sp. NPDC058257]|uniref:hypothetical protein n=1 Tax=Streptomyces sp. NPDC058257 TaxID=3346409 RepID=UPI0036EAC2F8
MRIRTALAATALAAAAVMGASGTALAHDDYDQGSEGRVAFENLGGAAGITEGAGHFAGGHDDDGHDDHDGDWKAGFAFENLGGPAGISHGAGYAQGSFDGHPGE